MPEDVAVFFEAAGTILEVGNLHRHARRGRESTSFEYAQQWLESTERFALEPSLPLQRGTFSPSKGRQLFGSLGDSAPDSWGRRLMQRRERRDAQLEGRAVRTLSETDYVLGVSDVARSGALRFRKTDDDEFQAPLRTGIPTLVDLGRLLAITERILNDTDVDGDLEVIFAPGSSLGGARPKASVLDQYGNLFIAKFPKDTDDYSIERWEYIALQLAAMAGVSVAESNLVHIASRPVLLSRRFDRIPSGRVHFISAMSLLEHSDGTRGSYPEIADVLLSEGSKAATDIHELYRRMAFHVLISNVDDHLRNHGFLHAHKRGWELSPAYDVNPVPADIRPRILSTNITIDDATCDVELVLEAAEFFNLSQHKARHIIKEIATATAQWRHIAAISGAPAREIQRMSSAFEHHDLERALTF